MIFTGLKRKSNQIFIKKKLIELLKNKHEKPRGAVKSALVFLNSNSNNEDIVMKLTSILNISKSDIKVVVFQQKLKKEQEADHIITPKDFGWFGKIDSEKLKNILTNKYDLLINYSKVDDLYLNLLLLQSEASFRVGFAHFDKQLYDLMISCKPDEIDLFNEELIKYLAILKML